MDAGWEMVSRSDIGKLRAHNEDAVYVNALLGLAILADGMGGYNAGEVASGMATTLLGGDLEESLTARGVDSYDAYIVLQQGITRVNAAVYAAAQSQPQFAGMGTTLVMAVFQEDTVTVAHVGDSRLYRLRGRDLTLMTRDHSLLQEQLDAGKLSAAEARHAQHKNLVTRALGVDPDVEPSIQTHVAQAGDLYLLCSDGLNDMVEDEDIAEVLRARGSDLNVAATALVQRAIDAGGRDNVSLILVRGPGAAVPQPWWRRLLDRLQR